MKPINHIYDSSEILVRPNVGRIRAALLFSRMSKVPAIIILMFWVPVLAYGVVLDKLSVGMMTAISAVVAMWFAVFLIERNRITKRSIYTNKRRDGWRTLPSLCEKLWGDEVNDEGGLKADIGKHLITSNDVMLRNLNSLKRVVLTSGADIKIYRAEKGSVIDRLSFVDAFIERLQAAKDIEDEDKRTEKLCSLYSQGKDLVIENINLAECILNVKCSMPDSENVNIDEMISIYSALEVETIQEHETV